MIEWWWVILFFLAGGVVGWSIRDVVQEIWDNRKEDQKWMD